ncbi:MAG TPA: AAA family ATPase [Stellaceae bacterium]|nr:AAA family ATPase [Stellaceae bacterium]
MSIVAGAAGGVTAAFGFMRWHMSRVTTAAPAEMPEPRSSPGNEETVEPPTEGVRSPEAIATILPPLAKELSPLAEDVGHPAELVDMPEFQAVLAALKRADVTIDLLRQHALGANWPVACAAFLALAEHPQRQSVEGLVVNHLPNLRPYVLMYTFRYLTSLEQRPPVGAAVVGAPPWWQNNPVIPGFVQDYFVRSAELGDRPEFGAWLGRRPEFDGGAVVGLLKKVQHPFASSLIAALRKWEDTRIDRAFLGTVGTVWNSAEQDPLLVAPDVWRELLDAARSSISQPRPRSILVCGEPLVGKTTFIELLGHSLQADGWTVFAASGAELMADQIYIGQLEGRIRKVVEALHTRRKMLWYVPDLGQIADSGTHKGQSASILDQIMPAMTAGHLIVIGETSQAAAARLFQVRPSLRSVMEVLPVHPMDEGSTTALARQVANRIGETSALAVPEMAVTAAMELAQHYLGTGQLPGGVLGLLRRAANRSILAGESSLTAASVIATFSQISGLPAVILDTNERVLLAEVHDFFRRRVMGQDEAIRAVVDRIAMLKAGLIDPQRPIGVFLFAGPTGTGKTELAKTLAEFLFGSADRLVRLDMSEFQTPESTSKILGQQSDNGVESLIDRIRKQPFSVVLLDEFEKAHSNCWDLFLQIFDDGRLSDARGKVADFRHCFIILTSNLGATAHRGSGLGFVPDTAAFSEDQVLRTVGATFRPEFVNRLDRIIVFRPLSREMMRNILHKELTRIPERRGLRERAWAVEWEPSAIEFLLDRGFSPEMGARPLKRAIDQLLLAPLAGTLVEHRFPKGDQFLFVRSDGRTIEVEFVDPDVESGNDTPGDVEATENVALPAIVLSSSGSSAERASLVACWNETEAVLNGEAWRARIEQLRLALADPAIWSRDDRHRVFSRLEPADRINEAERSAERLFRRYVATREESPRASRDLAGRLALQLYNLRQGIDDLLADAPVDVLMRVDPALGGGNDAETASWCRRILSMYRDWAGKRRMQVEELEPKGEAGRPILLVTGFGAFRTIHAEVGLHVLEEGQGSETGRRIVARVTAVAGPDAVPTADGYAATARLLSAVPQKKTIVRRYREEPAPIVRDTAGGWRSGRLAAVLGGDFDLIGAIKRQAAA